MQYKKIHDGETIIELHNNWLGEETIIVNGQIVSKKSSVFGINHYFTTMENGHTIRYMLNTRMNDNMQTVFDLSRNGKLIREGVPISFGSKPKDPADEAKKKGLQRLQEYDLENALLELGKALNMKPNDPEIYFHMACAHSVLEQTHEGFECLKNAVKYNLQNREMILNHDMLAFLRMDEAFEKFLDSGFVEYDRNALGKNEAVVGLPEKEADIDPIANHNSDDRKV